LQGSDGFRKLRTGAWLSYNGDGSDLEVVPMAARVRFVSALVAVLAPAAFLVSSGSAGSLAGAPPALPTLYVSYALNCTFTITDDSGRKVTAIAPGAYQIDVSTPTEFGYLDPKLGGCGGDGYGYVDFQLTGPGVNLSTTIDAGCETDYLFPPTSFKASSTFTAQELSQPSVTRSVFTTLASGSPPIPTHNAYTPTSGKGTTSQDIVGSGISAAVRGTLTGTLSASGKPTLTSKGKTVSTLKAGRYVFAITDKDPKASFILQIHQTGFLAPKSTDLTGVEFVGTQRKIVTLKTGKWMYYAGRGKFYHFEVTG
jgi:hypothetical protein